MSIMVGAAGIKNVMAGGAQAAAVYLGSLKVWPATPAKPVPVSSPITYQAASIALPPHQPGDLICVIATNQGSAITDGPTKPAAGGTVPNWLFPAGNLATTGGGIMPGSTSSQKMGLRMGYAVATASNHTSGTWTGTNNFMCAFVCPASSFVSAKAIWLKDTQGFLPSLDAANPDGASGLVYFAAAQASTGITFNPLEAGYTELQSRVESTRCVRLFSKDDTSSAGLVPQDSNKLPTVFWGVSMEFRQN